MLSFSVPKENGHERKQNMEQEITRLMDQYGNDVLRTAYMILRDIQKAEDAFQEVFIKVYRKYDNFRRESSEKTWIIKVTINVCRDMLRSTWIRKVLLKDEIIPSEKGSDISDSVIQKDENRILLDAVMSLPPVFKEVIILYYYQEYSTSDIGKILNTSEGTVRSRLHRAREQLRSKIGGRADGGGQNESFQKHSG